MARQDPTGTDWTEREIDLIVADYLDMLKLELRGEPFVKAQRNAELQRLTGRSRGSIEFKHQNISAVLMQIGRPWIRGYRPAVNYQRALVAGVERALPALDWLDTFSPRPPQDGFASATALAFDPPPPIRVPNAPGDAAIERLVRRFDAAARDARNRALGRHGEEIVLRAERQRLEAAGRPDLARGVRWIAEEEGDGAGYDILSFTPSGGERLLEVKTTTGPNATPFFLSETERLLSAERPDAFRLVRLYDAARSPRAFELAPPLEAALLFRCASYRAAFSP